MKDKRSLVLFAAEVGDLIIAESSEGHVLFIIEYRNNDH